MNIFRNNSFIRNAGILFSGSIITSILGFVYWIGCSKIFIPEEIGKAGALLSLSGIIVTIADFGLCIGLIRYFNDFSNKIKLVNVVITLTLCNSLIISILCCLVAPLFSIKFNLFNEFTNIILFSCTTISQSLIYTLGSIFLAMRKTQYGFYQDLSSYIIKMILIFPLYFILGGYKAILISTFIGLLAAGILLGFKHLSKTINNYKFKPNIDYRYVSAFYKCSFSNQTSKIMQDAQMLLIPVIGNVILTEKESGIFYVIWIFSVAFRIIPNSFLNSLFAEASLSKSIFKSLLLKSIRNCFIILLLIEIIVYSTAKYILLIFGSEYSLFGEMPFILLTLANLFWTLNYSAIICCRIHLNNLDVILIGLILVISTLFSVILLGKEHGMIGIGYGYIIGNAVASAYSIYVITKTLSINEY